MRKEKGVTLTALVITIIVVLILAGITINLTVGQDGIITKAQQAAKEMKKTEIKDTMKLDILTAETEAKIRGESLEKAQLNDIVAKYGELQEDGDTIITEEDKFEISLKEIWYGVLSDSGSYTDKVEQIEILEKELADLRKQYEELEKLNEGNVDVLNELNRRIAELEEEKKALEEQVETLISKKEELTAENTRLAEALVKLNEEYQAFKKTEGTATAGDIISGKTAWVNGSKITGTIVNRGALNASLNAGQSYTVPVGYTTGGKITANSLSSQTQATATSDNIISGKTAWVNGSKITGTIVNRGALNATLNAGQSYTIPVGYTTGGKITANSLANQTQATATANDIAKGKTAWVNGIKITGTGNFVSSKTITANELGDWATQTIQTGFSNILAFYMYIDGYYYDYKVWNYGNEFAGSGGYSNLYLGKYVSKSGGNIVINYTRAADGINCGTGAGKITIDVIGQ